MNTISPSFNCCPLSYCTGIVFSKPLAHHSSECFDTSINGLESVTCSTYAKNVSSTSFVGATLFNFAV